MIKTFAFIGLGGAVGSIVRYAIALLTERFFGGTIPLATLIVNLIGSFLIGLLISIFDKNFLISPNIKFFLITGFCGGFTTFSAFGSDAVSLFLAGQTYTALGYIFASVAGGITAVYLGFLLAS